MRPLRRHLTYANVMSSIAVFGVLATGGAYAADTIFSEDIADGEVRSVDIADDNIRGRDILDGTLGNAKIGNGAITEPKLANDAVTGPKVAPDSLGGPDIDESSLGIVGQAVAALGAGAVGGATRADLDTETFGNGRWACNPQSSTFVNCGTAMAVVVNAPSDVVVVGAGAWLGLGTGADSGECRITLDGGSPTEAVRFGAGGDPHNAGSRGGGASLVFSFQVVSPGTHEVRVQCRQTDGDFVVQDALYTAFRVGT